MCEGDAERRSMTPEMRAVPARICHKRKLSPESSAVAPSGGRSVRWCAYDLIFAARESSGADRAEGLTTVERMKSCVQPLIVDRIYGMRHRLLD